MTFHHISAETGTVDVKDTEIREYVNEVIKNLCSNERKPGEFNITGTGNLLVLGVKWEDSVDVYVTKDYWEDSIGCGNYAMVK